MELLLYKHQFQYTLHVFRAIVVKKVELDMLKY